MKVVDDVSLIGKRLCAYNSALRFAFHRACEYLLCREIRVEYRSRKRFVAAAVPNALRHKTYPEIRSVRGFILYRIKLAVVKEPTLFGKRLVVRFPCGCGVVVLRYADGSQYLRPKLFDRNTLSVVRKYLFCPSHGGNRRYRPLMSVFDLVAVRFHNL